MTSSTNRMLAGALLAGMGIITGEATLLATAGGVGVNWLAEGLAGLWPTLGSQPSDPLARAYTASIRDAVKKLEADYTRTVAPRADRAAFRLVAACAGEVAAAEFPGDVSSVDTAQTALNASLAALLHGHDERQAAFLRERLLAACAVAFQRQLVQDEAAWRAFHGLILQALAANSAVLLGRLDHFIEVLASWSNPQSSLAQLQHIEASLEALAAQPATASSVHFDNRGMIVKGNVYQAGQDQYLFSAHASGGATATVINTLGAPPSAGREALNSLQNARAAILFLAANPLDLQHLHVDQEARRVELALRQARGRFHLAQQWAVRSEDLLDALLHHRPVLLHFAGHGNQAGQLMLENAAGSAAPVQPEPLAALIKACSSVRCMVLNACWSDALASALLSAVPCVVGMTGNVDDAAAIAFAAGFYRALADGESVAAAVESGRAAAVAETGEQAALAVRVRAAAGVDPAAMRLI